MNAPAMSPGQFLGTVPAIAGSNTAWGARYARELRDVIIRQASRMPRNVQVHLGPSEIGSACDRQVVGKFAGEPRTNHVADPWPSIVGTAVHAWLAEHFAMENGLNGFTRWVTEQRVTPHPLYPGTADLYDGIEEALVDWKGLYVHTPIPTPSGWTTLGQLQPGDTVLGTDGRPCEVTRAYPVQNRDCYRVTFDDGASLIADDQQLWAVIMGARPRLRHATLTTTEAARNIWNNARQPQRHLRIPVNGALELPDAALPVHPYVLGCWLGDGGVHNGTIGTAEQDAEELFSYIQDCGYRVSAPYGQRKFIRNVYGLSSQLQVLGLQWRDPAWPASHGRLAGIKRLPAEYLRGSFEQRLSLLQGLMDTDGNWNKPRKRAVFSTVSKDLAEAVAELVITLGWKAHIAPHQSTGFGLTVTEYYVEFTPAGANPFRLQRKADQVRLTGAAKSRRRIIRSIEPVLSVPTRCIDVDSPDHLYLAGAEMIPVHNCLGPTSMAKVMSDSGPPRHYQVQLLLYALGYRNLGLPVRRVCLAALPRTGSSLDSMYLWEHECGPADDALIADVLDQTAYRREIAQLVMAGQIHIGDVPIMPSEDCYFCLSANTPVLTRDGIKPIRELAGTSPELLVPHVNDNPDQPARGDFVRAPIRMFGKQRLWKITLSKHRVEKVIYATAEHRWMLIRPPSRANPDNKYGHTIQGRSIPDSKFERITQELRPGDRLRPLRAATPARAEIMPWAVAQGFVFGDGTRGQGNRPATLNIYDNGKDEAMLPFFPFAEPAQYEGVQHIYGLPRFWKDLPPIRESRTFLLSWLAGYFAADGCVDEDGQVILCSAREETIKFARDIAAVCGIGYNPPRSQMRLGFSTEPTELWSLNLRRQDLPAWFFLIKEHARRAEAANLRPARESCWTVKSVQVTNRVEPVYCATVPGAEMFGLADDLLTGNCPYFRPESARDYNPGCPGHSPIRA